MRNGGFGEPYCSDKCYEDGGRYAFTLARESASGQCGFCRKPVTVGVSGGGAPHEGKTLYVCDGGCGTRARDYFKTYNKCCMCQGAV